MANEKSVFKYLICPKCGYKKTDPTGKAKGVCKNDNTPMYLSENWYARITHNGKSPVKAISPRKRDAEDYIASCKVAMRTGNLLPGEEKDVTWEDAKENVEQWLEEDVAAKKVRKSTEDFYSYMLVPLTDYFGTHTLLTITKEMVGKYVAHRQKQVSASTVKSELSALKRVYSLHLERLEMESRPKLMARAMIISKISPPKVDNEIDRFCEVSEVKNVFKVVEENKTCRPLDKQRTKLGLMLGVGLGMRPVNVCALEWKEIDFKNDVIRIPKQKMKNKKDYVTGLPETIKQELKSWRKQQKVISPFVFPSPKDPGKHIGSMKTALNRAIKKANLNPGKVDRKNKVTPYVLTRHTFASQALMKSKGDIVAVSEQLHHSNIAITKKRYAKLNVEYKKEKIDQFEATVLKKMIE